jgi:hypothetical protein
MPDCDGKISNSCKSLITVQGQDQKSEGASQIKCLSVGLKYTLYHNLDQKIFLKG